MPVVAFASAKGGVAKTTTAMLLGAELARLGASAVFLDADANQPLARWFEKRWRGIGPGADHPNLLCEAEVTRERMLPLIRAHQEADPARWILIDLPGENSQLVTYAMSRADIVVIPSQTSEMDMREARRAVAFLAEAEELFGRRIFHRVLFTKVHPFRTRIGEHMEAELAASGAKAFRTRIVERVAFREMTLDGAPPAFRDPTSSAARNVRAFFDELVALLDGAAEEGAASPNTPKAVKARAAEAAHG